MLALDPGSEQSALVEYRDGIVYNMELRGNDEMIKMLYFMGNPFWSAKDQLLVVEMVESYGMRVGRSVFDTCVWIGRFIESFRGPYDIVYRSEVKLHLCGSKRAKDADIRQALIDMYGNSKSEAVGTKKNPGPLHGIKKDLWSALAVAVTYDQTRRV